LKRTSDGTEVAKAWAQIDITSMAFNGDASFQNTAEYMGSLLCARGIAMLGAAGEPLLFRGDSMSALTWVEKGTARSAHATRAAAMWAQYSLHHHINVVDTVHVAHEFNTRTDVASRQGSWEDILADDRKRYGGTLPADLPKLDLQCGALIHLVNPKRPLTTETEFNKFFGESMTFLAQDCEQALVVTPV
jgi:hypothetical protein